MIRAATQHDIDDVLSLYTQLFSEMAALDPERSKAAEQLPTFVNTAITDKQFHLLVAEHAGMVIGFCLAQIQLTPAYNCLVPRRYAYIFDLMVSAEYRGNKAGQQLLQGMKLWAKEQQLTHLELSVFAQNKAAIRFYQREGLKSITQVMGIKI
nr:GNAT family N-acetyltransferase [uncultured Moellerella sp.]